jgi:hypothetical protein
MLPNFVKIRGNALSTKKPTEAIVDKPVVVFKLPSLSDHESSGTATATIADEISVLSDDVHSPSFRVHDWDQTSGYSDYIKTALTELKRDTSNVVTLFESPSSSNPESAFYNSQVFKFHISNSAPTNLTATKSAKSMLGPCRYSLFNGTAFPTYNRYGEPPPLLLEHWQRTIPNFQKPQFVSEIDDDSQVYAYLPCESIKHHVNDPHVHYHIAGKDAIHLMTKQTTALLPSTKALRPCIAKTTHSMSSQGVFIIRNDQDEADFEDYIASSGKPSFVVTEFIEIERNVACHFFIHPNGQDVTWFGSNENHRLKDGTWSLDSYLLMKDQAVLKEMQLPFVKDIVAYCHSLSFFGFCGVDVLFDKSGQGYLVDVNPRVTGSCPSLMVAQLFQDKYGFEYGLFRRSGDVCFYGPEEALFEQVETYNVENEGTSKIVIFAVCQVDEQLTKINIGVYGNSLEDCKIVLNRFAQPKPAPTA